MCDRCGARSRAKDEAAEKPEESQATAAYRATGWYLVRMKGSVNNRVEALYYVPAEYAARPWKFSPADDEHAGLREGMVVVVCPMACVEEPQQSGAGTDSPGTEASQAGTDSPETEKPPYCRILADEAERKRQLEEKVSLTRATFVRWHEILAAIVRSTAQDGNCATCVTACRVRRLEQQIAGLRGDILRLDQELGSPALCPPTSSR